MNQKQRKWSNELYERGSEFHGHGGPFMVIGLRMGLIALQKLDSNGCFNLRCEATLRWTPPDSCVLDGIQSSSGCTMGKKNITAKEGSGIQASFQTHTKTINIILKPEIYEEIKKTMKPGTENSVPDHENEALVKQLIEAKDTELFIITNQIQNH